MGDLTITNTNDSSLSQRNEISQFQNAKKNTSGIFEGFFNSDWSGKQIANLTGDNYFTDWLQDKDKVCTDSCDDGNLSFWEATQSFGKGLAGIVKTTINHPIATVATMAVGSAAMIVTGGAIAPALIALGVASGTGMIAYGGYKVAMAKTDAEAKNAWEKIGEGTFAVVGSTIAAKKALKTAGNAGVLSASGREHSSTTRAVKQCFESFNESLKVSYKNGSDFYRSLSGVSIPNLTEEEIFLRDKTKIENNIEEIVHNLESSNSKNIKSIITQENIEKTINSINKDNIEIAKKLFAKFDTNAFDTNCTSTWEQEKKAQIIFREIPRILNSNNEDMLKVAELACDSKEFGSDAELVLELLRKSNAKSMLKDMNSIINKEDIYPEWNNGSIVPSSMKDKNNIGHVPAIDKFWHAHNKHWGLFDYEKYGYSWSSNNSDGTVGTLIITDSKTKEIIECVKNIKSTECDKYLQKYLVPNQE